MNYRYLIALIGTLTTASLLPSETTAASSEAMRRALGIANSTAAPEEFATIPASTGMPTEEVTLQVEAPSQDELPSGILQRITEEELAANPQAALLLEQGPVEGIEERLTDEAAMQQLHLQEMCVDEEGNPTVSSEQQRECAAGLLHRQRM